MPNIHMVRRVLLGAPAVVAGTALDTDYSLWKAAVGSVGATQETATNALIVALKGHSLWTKADRIWLYGSENATQASIDLKGLVAHTLVGTPTFTASQGYTGNGSDYIETNFVPPTHGVAYLQNSASLGVYIRNNRTADANVTAIGMADNVGVSATVQPNAFGNGNFGAMHDGSAAAFGSSVGTARGFYVMTRTASNARALYNRGSSLGSDSTASASISAMPEAYVLAYNNNGSAILKSSDQIAVVWIGGALDATNNTDLYTDIQAYMTALGTNV